MPAQLTAAEAIDRLNAAAHRADSEEKAAAAVGKAKTQLVLAKDAKSVFFATLALRLIFKPDWTIDTAATDGRHLYYNPDFVIGLPAAELVGLLAHEVLHCTGKHFARRAGRDPSDWNIACDLAINPILLDAGFELPDGGLIPGGEHYEDMEPGRSAEEYYAAILARKPEPADDNANGSPAAGDSADSSTGSDFAEPGEQSTESTGAADPGQCGGVIDPEDSTDENGETTPTASQLDSEWSANIAAAQQAAERRGTLSAGLARLCGEALTPSVDWKTALREFITRPAKRDYNWKRPNRRHIHRGLYLPSVHSLEIGHIVAAVDTSGSISEDTLTRFASELADIANQGASRVTIIYHDSDVVKVEEWTPDEGPLTLTPCGGGGTDHRPVFDWIADNCDESPAVMIGLTDLASRFPTDAPPFPVLWASTDSRAAHPFGERCTIPAA